MTAENKKRILLIEDDFKLANLVREYLEAVGYVVLHESNGARAPALIIREQPDIVLLDLMLPGLDGIQVCRQIREKNADGMPKFRGPVIMLTALSDENHEINGLDAGANDYLPKPVRPRKLLARIEALLRETEQREAEQAKLLEDVAQGNIRAGEPAAAVITCGELEVRTTEREVWMHGELAHLFCAHCLENLVAMDEKAGAVRGQGEGESSEGIVAPLMVRNESGIVFSRKKDREDRTALRGMLEEALKAKPKSLSALIDLTGAEYELLVYLAMRKGQIVGREQIYRDIRKIEWDGMDRSIDLRVTRLRRKLGDDARAPKIIKSVRGEGYLMSPNP